MLIEPRIAKWLAGRDTGASSKAILLWISAKEKDPVWGASTPSDPADLGRCLRLLEAIPELAERFAEMRDAGGEWPTFVERWQEMAAMMAAECGISWEKAKEAPKTYALMKEVEVQAREAAGTAGKFIQLGSATVRFPS